eukprot:8288696-Lingulodinium_polyedra.AAC.1
MHPVSGADAPVPRSEQSTQQTLPADTGRKPPGLPAIWPGGPRPPAAQQLRSQPTAQDAKASHR